MKHTRLVWIATLALLTACGGEESPTPPAPPAEATPPAAPAPTPVVPAPTPGVPSAGAPPAGGACAVPEGSLRGDAKLGEADYNQFCMLCHGPTAPPMQPPPANHHDCKYMGALTDAHLYSTICGGGASVGKAATMPPWGAALPPDRIKNVIAHLRSFCPS